MENRYSLRFESGERRGETIAIPEGGLTVGRKPGNTLQILDNSVSGNHAVLSVENDGVLLRDTGSTNGTRVGSARVLEQRLAHGDTVLFGNMRFTFHDSRGKSAPAGDGIELEGFDEPLPAESALTATTMTPGAEGFTRVSAEHLAQSKSRSLTGLIGVGVLALAGAGLWFWFQRGGSEGAAGVAVVPVPDNLLADGFSFEGDEAAWSNAEGTPAAFVRSGPSHRSGAFGVEAELEEGQWALYRSRPVRVTAGRSLAARAYVRIRGDAEARVGIEYSNRELSGAPVVGSPVAWSASVNSASGFADIEVSAVVPAGWSQACVVLLARSAPGTAAGEVAADDVCLVPVSGETRAAASASGADVYVLGDTSQAAQLVRSERVLVSGLCFTMPGDVRGSSAAALTVRTDGDGLAIEPKGNAAMLVLRAEEPLAQARVATIGKDGYRTHALEFEREGVETLLLGSGADMVRIRLAQPATVSSAPEGGAARLTVTPASKLEIKLDFAAERKEAGNVAYAARGAEQRGELGAAIAQWQALLNGFPYEDALVNEAEAAHTRLVQKGLAELRAVEAEVERARFFRLADLYRECRQSALALAERFKPSEVETQAQKLADSVTQDIRELEVDVHKAERARMKSILAALQAQGATALATEVQSYLTENLADQAGEQK